MRRVFFIALVTGIVLSVTIDVVKYVIKSFDASSHTKSTEFAESSNWDYSEDGGNELWGREFRSCKGGMQSPINIDLNDVRHDDSLNPLTFVGYEAISGMVLENTGRTVSMTVSHRSNRFLSCPAGIKDGGLDSFYMLTEVNFHWGSDNLKGSEHTIDERRFPMEMQIVHKSWDSEMKTAILSVFLEVTEENNVYLQPIVEGLKKVIYRGTDVDVSFPVQLNNLLPLERAHFYRYVGSLTAPPCSQDVIWTVFGDPIPIGVQQIAKFRKLRSTYHSIIRSTIGQEALTDNFREIQKLNKRKVIEALPKCSK